MKIKCISTKTGVLNYRFLTIDKIYEVLIENEGHYKIVGDDNDKSYYRKDCFVGIDVIREEKLKQLGI